ncbi:MAG: exodeoxyribonuclease III [Crocinitomicaceae bacterium]|nr:exodeoxyribonuclease III [Crocinitomicaceae bacterium]
MKLYTWNVNGIRAVVKKEFGTIVKNLDPDVLGLQETKAQDDQVREALAGLGGLSGYKLYSSSAIKKGYSGTAILTKTTPISVAAGIGIDELDQEGRLLCAEFESFFYITVYTPNSSSGLKRLPFRKRWDEAFLDYIQRLDSSKPVVVTGDLNVAHQAIDLARPDSNYNKTPGYTQDEIDGISKLIDNAQLIDTWRNAHPGEIGYSWWSYRGGAREKNIGWRLDYILVSERLNSRVHSPTIHSDVFGSDHCPVSVEIAI